MAAPEENAYEILGLAQGFSATDGDIKKAYRKLALEKHPDKNPDNPNAADEFSVIQRAYELLTDEEARKALDDFLKARAARAERTVIHDQKRRRMAEDLLRREQASEALSTEAQAKARLASEIARMRRTAQEREAKQRAAAQQHATNINNSREHANGANKDEGKQTQSTTGAGPPYFSSPHGGDVASALPRTLKVSWTRPGLEYDAGQLRRIFSAHGVVEDVVMREGKKRKGSALVVMATMEGVKKASESLNGEISNPLLVIPLTKGSETNGQGSHPEIPSVPLDNGHLDVQKEHGAQVNRNHHEGPSSALPPGSNEVRPARSLGPRPVKPLFPGGARPSAAIRAASAGFAGFNSFQQPAVPAVGSGGGGSQIENDAKKKQAEARERMIAQLQQEENDDE